MARRQGACGSFPSVMPSSRLPQFHKDMKDAQELLRKVDSDLNQKYSPDFKDRYQLELLLRELDVSGGCEVPCQAGHRSPHLPALDLSRPHPVRASGISWVVGAGLTWCSDALAGPGEGSGQV